MADEIVRHRLVRDTVVDEDGLVVSTSVRDVELPIVPEKRSTRKIFYPKESPKRPTRPPAWIKPRKIKTGKDIDSKARKTQVAQTSEQRPCPWCNESVPSGKMREHKLQCSERKPATTKRVKPEEAYTSRAYDQPVYWTCPQCGEQMRSDHIANHLLHAHTPQGHTQPQVTEHHRNKAGKKEKSKRVSEPATQRSDSKKVGKPKKHPKPDARSPRPDFNSPSALVGCPVCGVFVRSDRLSEHLRKVHKTNEVALGAVEPVRLSKDTTAPRRLDEFEQDGSKNIGFLARERGRFGSHPMHDDYNDEGGAD